MRRPRWPASAGCALLAAALAACSGGATPSASTPGPASVADPFAGLPYRLELPSGWIALGSAAYDPAVDATDDVAGWLRDLELAGEHAFRAYEPQPGAAGMRLAINPPVTWSADASGPLDDAALLAALPGVRGEPEGDYVGVGAAAKGLRFRWSQALDWGGGATTTRTCVGYQVMTEFDPVNVVFSYPEGADRLAEVEAMMATFTVTGSARSSVPPGATPTAAPTPYDKYGSPEPVPTAHADPALEALLPDTFEGRALTKSSRSGDELGISDTSPLMKAFGKQPADISGATALPSEPPLLIISVTRLRGVAASDLLAAIIADLGDAKVSQVTLDGRPVTYVESGAWPVWYYASGEYLYGITAMGDAEVARVLALLD